MAVNVPDMSAFLNPHLCANNQRKIDRASAPYKKDATLACSGCHLLQVRLLFVVQPRYQELTKTVLL
jgi:hypothetical protein